jgi:hypothetical protein
MLGSAGSTARSSASVSFSRCHGMPGHAMLEDFRQRREDQFDYGRRLGAVQGFDEAHDVGGGDFTRGHAAQPRVDDALDMLAPLLHRAGGQRRKHLRHVVVGQLPEALGCR